LPFSVFVVIEFPSMYRTFSAGGLEDKTLPWHVPPGLKKNFFETKPSPQFQNVFVPLAMNRGHLLGVTKETGLRLLRAKVKEVRRHVESHGRSNELVQGRVVRPGNDVIFQFPGGLKPDPCDWNRRFLQTVESFLEPPNGFIQRERDIPTRTPKDFKRRTPENEGRMDPEKVGAERSDEVEGTEKAVHRIPRKADHELDSHLKMPLLQPRDGRNGVCRRVPSIGEEQHLINHGLHADLHRPYTMLLEEVENLFTEGVGPG
jgi:hypothetical protein